MVFYPNRTDIRTYFALLSIGFILITGTNRNYKTSVRFGSKISVRSKIPGLVLPLPLVYYYLTFVPFFWITMFRPLVVFAMFVVTFPDLFLSFLPQWDFSLAAQFSSRSFFQSRRHFVYEQHSGGDQASSPFFFQEILDFEKVS